MTEQDEQLIAQLISIVALSSFIITKIVITNYNWAAQIRLCKCCKLIFDYVQQNQSAKFNLFSTPKIL